MAEYELKMPINGQITTFQNIHRKKRLAFARYISAYYEMPVQTAYGKFRCDRIEPWELDGIDGCITEFFGGTMPIDINAIFEELRIKAKFIRFMEGKGMCQRTAFYRFKKMDFKKWERKGIRNIWQEFLAQQCETE